MGRTYVVEHRMKTGDTVLMKLPPRKIPLALADKDQKELEKLKKQGAIQPSTSTWAVPLVIVWKKGGSARMCLDYCRLNAVSEDVAYPITHMQDCLDTVAGSGVLSVMDITAAYHQIPVAAENILKTAFITKYGLYGFKTMPFGLKTAPLLYQQLMELGLSRLQWTVCLIYLDDVIIFKKHLKSTCRD